MSPLHRGGVRFFQTEWAARSIALILAVRTLCCLKREECIRVTVAALKEGCFVFIVPVFLTVSNVCVERAPSRVSGELA